QFRGEIQASLKVCEQLLEMAEGLKDGALMMEAHRAMGAVLVILGRCAEAVRHLNQGAALYATYHDHSHSAFFGLDCKVICECFYGRALWALGYPEEAAERTAGALQFARALASPQTLVVACHFAAQLHQLSGEASLVY